MLPTKFGDHPSISSVGEDKGFSIFSPKDPLKGPIKQI
jgi:hypothetical protein